MAFWAFIAVLALNCKFEALEFLLKIAFKRRQVFD